MAKSKTKSAQDDGPIVTFKGGAQGEAISEMTPRAAAIFVALAKGAIKRIEPLAETLPAGQYLGDFRDVDLRGDVHVENSTEQMGDDFGAEDVLAVLLDGQKGAEGRIANIVRDLKAGHATKRGTEAHAKNVKLVKSWIKGACLLKKAQTAKGKAGAVRCVPTIEIGEARVAQ